MGVGTTDQAGAFGRIEGDHAGFAGVQRVGLTSGASAPEDVVQRVISRMRELGVAAISEVEAPDEKVVFTLPPFTPLTKSGAVVR